MKRWPQEGKTILRSILVPVLTVFFTLFPYTPIYSNPPVKVDSPIKFEGVKAVAQGVVVEPIPEPTPPPPAPAPKPKPKPQVTQKPLPPSDLDGLFQKHFGANWQKAKAIAKCESGLNPGAHNYNPRTKDNSYGLFQINLYGKLAANRPEGSWLLVAENNIEYASRMSGHGTNWKPWTCARKLGIR